MFPMWAPSYFSGREKSVVLWNREFNNFRNPASNRWWGLTSATGMERTWWLCDYLGRSAWAEREKGLDVFCGAV